MLMQILTMIGKRGNMKIVKCKNKIVKKGVERECDRFLMKLIDDKTMDVKCPNCGHYAIITIKDNKLVVIHLDKDGENKICQQ